LRPLRKMLATRTSREGFTVGLLGPPQPKYGIGILPMPGGTSPSFAVTYCGSTAAAPQGTHQWMGE
jgi:hypothetical protein